MNLHDPWKLEPNAEKNEIIGAYGPMDTLKIGKPYEHVMSPNKQVKITRV